MRASAVILAAGRGQRMGLAENKAFLQLGGRAVLAWSVKTLASIPRVDEVIVVARASEREIVAASLPELPVPVLVVTGGQERVDSARAGVAAARAEAVVVHDAARPFVSRRLVERVLDAVELYGACVPTLPEVDTLRRVDAQGRLGADAIERQGLARIQTPQGFRTDLLRRALAACSGAEVWTDDAAAVLALGLDVVSVPGEPWNVKLTTPDDLEFAGRLARLLDGSA
ncbi:MAG: 2-C-methyl-D-erythritol 4-phosphate cytidylyltransferase [Candidatus Bipolaricaulota bacterium]